MQCSEDVKKSKAVCAIVVAYYPDVSKMQDQIALVARQVFHVLIIDNTPKKRTDRPLSDNIKDVTVIQNGQNIGLSRAQNIGIQWVLDHGYDYVLILDQDSIPGSAMVEKLLSSFVLLKRRGIKLAAVGPRYGREDAPTSCFLRFGKYRYEYIECNDKKPLVPCSFLISSGMLIPTEVFSQVGLMDETLFIDHVDTEWCMRAMSMGYASYGVCDAYMAHELGERVVKVWWGRDRNISIHHAFRLYYIFRNSILLYKRKYLSMRWKIFDLKRLMFFPVLYLLYSDEKLRSLKYMALGILHGLLGRVGKLKE